MVRREESQRREEQLSRAEEEWKREKQQFFQEAHQGQLRAIARQTAILEEQLKKEFRAHLDELEAKHAAHLEKTVQKTWDEAELVKEEAVAKTRLEEQHLAEEEARRVANRLAQEKQRDKEEAEHTMAQALDQRTQYMQQICQQSLAEQKRELAEQHGKEMAIKSGEYEARIARLELQLSDKVAENNQLTTDLHEMTESRDSWELRYQNLKIEFSDFIDQFPGFRAEFLLK